MDLSTEDDHEQRLFLYENQETYVEFKNLQNERLSKNNEGKIFGLYRLNFRARLKTTYVSGIWVMRSNL